MTCPKCNSEIYDNRADKASGVKSAKWPDFKCKSKSCDWAQWPEKGQKATPSAPIVAPSAVQPQSGAFQPGRDAALIELYWDSYERVTKRIAAERMMETFKGEAIAAMIATLFIQRARG